jgi:hypothetical protein
MRVKKLYIIQLGPEEDSEAKNVCQGLFSKHISRADAIAELFAKVPATAEQPSTVTLKKKRGDITGMLTTDVIQSSAQESVETAALLARKQQGRETGVYIVSHGTKNLDGTKAKCLVNVLTHAIPEAALTSISKIVSLACVIARTNKQNQNFQTVDSAISDDQLKDLSFMVGFMKLLDLKGIHPIVAGYDEYISALPHNPGKPDPKPIYDPATVRAVTVDPDPANTLKPKTDWQQTVETSDGTKFSMLRGKIGGEQKSGYVVIDEAFRRERKRFYRVVDGQVQFSTHPEMQGIDWSAMWADWSDKPS